MSYFCCFHCCGSWGLWLGRPITTFAVLQAQRTQQSSWAKSCACEHLRERDLPLHLLDLHEKQGISWMTMIVWSHQLHSCRLSIRKPRVTDRSDRIEACSSLVSLANIHGEFMLHAPYRGICTSRTRILRTNSEIQNFEPRILRPNSSVNCQAKLALSKMYP